MAILLREFLPEMNDLVSVDHVRKPHFAVCRINHFVQGSSRFYVGRDGGENLEVEIDFQAWADYFMASAILGSKPISFAFPKPEPVFEIELFTEENRFSEAEIMAIQSFLHKKLESFGRPVYLIPLTKSS